VFDGDVAGHEPCFPDDCQADFLALSDGARSSIAEMAYMLGLVIRFHREASGHGSLVLEFRSAIGTTMYAEVGFAYYTDDAKPVMLTLCDVDWLDHDAGVVPFRLSLEYDKDVRVDGLPCLRPQAERVFLRGLVALHASAWAMAVMKVVPYDLWSVNVTERELVDLGDLQSKDAARLEALAAKAMVTRINKKRVVVSGVAEMSCSGSDSESASNVSVDAEPAAKLNANMKKLGLVFGLAAVALDSDCDEVPPPKVGDPRKERGGFLWPGPGGFLIKEVFKGNCWVGMQATCGRPEHFDSCAEESYPCRRQVTFGQSGLSADDLTIRLKRWLVAGFDSADWPPDRMRKTHMGLGGTPHLHQLAVGLDDDSLTKIALSYLSTKGTS